MSTKVMKNSLPSLEKMVRKIIKSEEKPTYRAYKKHIKTLSISFDDGDTFYDKLSY